MKLTAEQMEKLIRAERRDAIKALNDTEQAVEKYCKTVKLSEVE